MPEFSAPQTFTIPEDASAVDSVFAFAKTKPAAVVYKRKVGNAWVDVTAGDFAAQVTAVAKGLIAIGVKQATASASCRRRVSNGRSSTTPSGQPVA